MREFLSDLGEEIRLLFSKRQLDNRVGQWKKHVNKFGAICDKTNPPYSKGETIKFAFNHLNTLDTKYGFLLASQAFLAAVVGFSVTTFPWDKIGRAPGKLAHLSPTTWFVVILILALWWTINVTLTLGGMYRVVWGDMWKYEDELSAQEQYIEELVTRIARRTAIYRIAILTTIVGVFGAALFTLAIIDLKRHQIPEEKPDSDRLPIQTGCQVTVQTGPSIKYEIVNPQEHVAGGLSRSHTFLLNKETGEVWQMSCRKGKKTVEFLVAPRRDEDQPAHESKH